MSAALPAVVAELRRAWLTSGESLASVGERMGGLAPQNVSASLNGTYDIRLSSLIRLAAAFGYDVTLTPHDLPGTTLPGDVTEQPLTDPISTPEGGA